LGRNLTHKATGLQDQSLNATLQDAHIISEQALGASLDSSPMEQLNGFSRAMIVLPGVDMKSPDAQFSRLVDEQNPRRNPRPRYEFHHALHFTKQDCASYR
jgi:hypothetical protein